MKKILILLLCLAQVYSLSCETKNDDTQDCTDLACTEIFVTISVTVKDRSGVAVPLDSFQVIVIENNEDLTRELSASGFEMARQSGTYPLFGDEYTERFQNDSLMVLFRAFVDGDEVVNSEFVVGADCCHVLLLEGDTDIIIAQ